MSEVEFEDSTLAKVTTLLELHQKIKYPKTESMNDNAPVVSSLKDIPGFI